MAKLDKFLQYGVSTALAKKAITLDLTVSKCRSYSQSDLVEHHGLTLEEAKMLAYSVKRKPIDDETLNLLKNRSNAVCCVCKGDKGKSFIVHHIIPYEKTQDNTYCNLIILCPNDHDMAHQSGLTMKHDENFLRQSKKKWERQVERANEARASQAIEVNSSAIDYINVNRIEELCISLFNEIPETPLTQRLKRARILNELGSFDQRYVAANLSGRKFLFDFIAHGETTHYHNLMQKIAQRIDFLDLKGHLSVRKLKEIEGRYAYFVAGIYSKGPKMPFNESTPSIKMHYKKGKYRIEWELDPNFIMSVSAASRLGSLNKYLIYCRIGSILKKEDKTWLIKCSPLFICQPSVSTDNTPMIHYKKKWEEQEEEFRLE